MAGRPTKLTPGVQDTIVKAVRAGAYIETAAAFAGIGKKTFYNWLKRGQTEPKYRAFLHAIEKAEADWEVRDTAIVGEAAKTQWQAAAWRLERKRPERWGRREHMTPAGDQELPVLVVRKRG